MSEAINFSKTNASAQNSMANEKGSVIERLLGGISLGLLEAFCRRMALGLRSGVDLLRLLQSEAKIGPRRHREVAQKMMDEIRGGNTLVDAINAQGHYFPTLLGKMVGAGEHAGGLDRTFNYMADYYRDLKKTRSEFLSQITLPVIQLGIAILICCGLIFINGFLKSGAPNEPAFDLTGFNLRGGTGILIFLSFIGSIALVIGVVTIGIWRNWFGCHRVLVPMIRNVPVLGTVFTTSALSRLSMTLSMMLGAGVDARRSARDALLATGNYYYISGLGATLQEIERGKSFAESFQAGKVLPDDFIQAVEIGELSGNDSESLERMAETYREKSQLALKQLAITSGVLIWFMIAGIIVFAIFTIFFQYLNLLTSFAK